MTLPTKLLWLDMETTGLEPMKHEILEVAAFVADFKEPLSVPAQDNRWVVRHVYKTNWDDVSSEVKQIHVKSGLIGDCMLTGVPVSAMEDDLIMLLNDTPGSLKATLPDAGSVVLAGNSLTLDRGFIRRYMMKLEKYLHYRMYDVSSMRTICYSLGMPELPKHDGNHRGKQDVIDSVNLALTLCAWLKVDVPGHVSGIAFRDRRSVDHFAGVMKAKLAANQHKDGWDQSAVEDLMKRLKEETAELVAAIKASATPDLVARECADVANFCMMVSEQYARYHDE